MVASQHEEHIVTQFQLLLAEKANCVSRHFRRGRTRCRNRLSRGHFRRGRTRCRNRLSRGKSCQMDAEFGRTKGNKTRNHLFLLHQGNRWHPWCKRTVRNLPQHPPAIVTTPFQGKDILLLWSTKAFLRLATPPASQPLFYR